MSEETNAKGNGRGVIFFEFYNGRATIHLTLYPIAEETEDELWGRAMAFIHGIDPQADLEHFILQDQPRGYAKPQSVNTESAKDEAPAKPTVPEHAETSHPKEVIDTTSIYTLEVVKVGIVPMKDGKVEVQLFGKDRKYPDLYHKGKIETILKYLNRSGLEWNREMLQTADSFDLQFYADWVNSEKTTTGGKPYKDVIDYRPME